MGYWALIKKIEINLTDYQNRVIWLNKTKMEFFKHNQQNITYGEKKNNK